MTTTTVKMKKNNTVLIAASLLALIGIGAWVYQLISGMQVTGLGQQIVWGLYIAAFFTAVGAGAGLLVLTGVSEYLPVISPEHRVRTLYMSLASLVVGGLLITLDVGNPVQIWRIMTAFRLSSMMTWDFWLLVVAVLVGFFYLLAVRGGKAQKAWGAVGMLAGVAVVVVEGWMLTAQAAHPMWGSGLTVLSFLLGAGIAGMSVALIGGGQQEKLAIWLKVALGLSLVFVLAEVLTGLVGGKRRHSPGTDRVCCTGLLAAGGCGFVSAALAADKQHLCAVGAVSGGIWCVGRESLAAFGWFGNSLGISTARRLLS